MKSIDIVALRGGFGNQLFCWAYGTELESQGRAVVFDRGRSLGRGYALGPLIKGRQLLTLPGGVWRRLSGLQGNRLYNRFHVHLAFEAEARRNLSTERRHLVGFHFGYWQSLRYFASVEETVIGRLSNWLELPRSGSTDYCAVHVRRGDYVTDPGAAATLGALDRSYYIQAIDLMRAKGFDRFVVYSDDREWVHRNLRMPGLEVAQPGTALDDFVGIARGRGVVMSNSTFSWWASLLSDSRGGTILGPDRWYRDNRLGHESILLSHWGRL